MVSKQVRKLVIWLILTINLILAFYIGIVVSSQFIELSLLIFVIIGGNYFVINESKLDNSKPNMFKKILIWLLLTTNLLFAFIIGFTLPILVSESKDMLGYVMIPLLIILNYIILDRFHYYQKHTEDRLES